MGDTCRCSHRQLGALTLTVGADQCALQATGYAAFPPSPNVHQTTPLEYAKYYLCIMENDVIAAIKWLGDEIYTIWNDLWSFAQKYIVQPLSQTAHELWDAVKDFWNWFYNEWSKATAAMKLIGVAAAVGFGYYIASRFDKQDRLR
jgi:hypothetical protein